ncbi:hypothetical protein [Streptomyces chartreusis]
MAVSIEHEDAAFSQTEGLALAPAGRSGRALSKPGRTVAARVADARRPVAWEAHGAHSEGREWVVGTADHEQGRAAPARPCRPVRSASPCARGPPGLSLPLYEP